jgi:hypothetical protein
LIQATQFFYFVDAQHSTHQCEMQHSFSSYTAAKTTLSRQNVTCLLYCCKIIQAVMQLVQSRVSQFSTRIFTVAAILPWLAAWEAQWQGRAIRKVENRYLWFSLAKECPFEGVVIAAALLGPFTHFPLSL